MCCCARAPQKIYHSNETIFSDDLIDYKLYDMAHVMIAREQTPPKVVCVAARPIACLKYSDAGDGAPTGFFLVPGAAAEFDAKVPVRVKLPHSKKCYVVETYHLKDGRGWVHGFNQANPTVPQLQAISFSLSLSLSLSLSPSLSLSLSRSLGRRRISRRIRTPPSPPLKNNDCE